MEQADARVAEKGTQIAVFILFLNILLGTAGSVLITPVLPTLLSSLTKQGIATNSIWSGLLFSSYGLMQLPFAPVVRSLSDRYGRRPVLLVSSLEGVMHSVL